MSVASNSSTSEPGSSVIFRFVYVPAGDGIIGYDEDQRLKIVKQTFQPFFGHNSSPSQRVRIQQGFFVLDREVTFAQYSALMPRSNEPSVTPNPVKGVNTSPATDTGTEKLIDILNKQKGKRSATPASKSDGGLDLHGDIPEQKGKTSTTPASKPDGGLDLHGDIPEQKGKTSTTPASKPDGGLDLHGDIPEQKGKTSTTLHRSPMRGLTCMAILQRRLCPPSTNKRESPKLMEHLAVAADQPASSVSWHEANSFCAQLQMRLGLVVRLPSEVEWEYAARGNSKRLYPWEDEGFYAWAEHPDASPRPYNPLSKDVSWVCAHDMAGNLSEWCMDTYHESLFDKPSALLLYSPLNPTVLMPGPSDPKPGADQTHKKKLETTEEPPKYGGQRTEARQSPEKNSIAVTYRGGSYRDSQFNCQSPVRRSAIATQQDPAIGFRPVLILKKAP